MLDLQTEDRAKDTLTFRLGAKRRYMLTALLGSVGVVAALLGVSPVSLWTVLAIVGSAFALNFLLTRLATGACSAMWSMRYLVAALDVVAETASVSHAQSVTMETLTATMTGVQEVATDASSRASMASVVATQQTASLDGLSTTTRQLAELSDRLRHSISRFSVVAPQGDPLEELCRAARAPAVPTPAALSADVATAAR
jgi:hypothetical protein